MSISRTRRRIGIAGATAALLTSAALGMGAASPGSAYADEVTPSDGAAPAGAEAAPVDASAEESAPSDASETGAATVSVGIPGTYAASESQAALDRINAIRAEAAAEGITVDGAPVSGAPLLQSSGLEYVAQVLSLIHISEPTRP